MPRRGLRSVRCHGGPWHGERHLLGAVESSLPVPGVTAFRYELRRTTRGEEILEWSFVWRGVEASE